jgi:hypothetical protein
MMLPSPPDSNPAVGGELSELKSLLAAVAQSSELKSDPLTVPELPEAQTPAPWRPR